MPPRLTARQSEVLTRLDTHKYREIGAALGLTRDGVRYHVKNLFATLRVHDRRDAVRRARVLGLPPLDREIGAALELTRDGVRYHVKNLFATLRVHDRRDAVRRARVLGLPPLDD